jgi:hypothetical protein
LSFLSTPSIVDNGDATAITIDSSEQIGIGTTAPNDYDNNSAGISSNLVVKDSGHSGIIVISGTSSDAAISFGDGTGTAAYRGAVAYVNSADALYFKAAGANKLRLDSDGLKFGSDTAAANALDDYEEGTFSGTTDGSVYSGTYTKIGRICHVSFESDNSSSTGVSIAVMPFSAKAGTPVNGSQPTFNTSNTNDNVYVAIYNGGSTAYIYSRTGSTQSVTTGSISVNFVYETD